ncbi:MAG: hypothetical protein WDA00_06945 [Eubacteriales bacterium]
MFAMKKKKMHPVCTFVVTLLSLTGLLTLIMLVKKKAGCASKTIQKFGHECAGAAEELMDDLKGDNQSDT